MRLFCKSIRDGNGRTALHFAATGGSADVVGAILDMAPGVINFKVNILEDVRNLKSLLFGPDASRAEGCDLIEGLSWFD